MRVLVVHRGVATAEFVSPYDPTWVELLKVNVPPVAKRYSPGNKSWMVTGLYVSVTLELARGHFDQVEELWPGGQSSTRSTPGHTYTQCLVEVKRVFPDHAELGLLPSASTKLVQAAYRVAAKNNHPDIGGDTEVMKRVNAAYSRLRK